MITDAAHIPVWVPFAQCKQLTTKERSGRLESMRKINLRKEKLERNKTYAKRFEKTYDQKQDEKKNERKFKAVGGKYGRWCRIKGHSPTCDCVYPQGVTAGRK